jgi:hypothetical protein
MPGVTVQLTWKVPFPTPFVVRRGRDPRSPGSSRSLEAEHRSAFAVPYMALSIAPADGRSPARGRCYVTPGDRTAAREVHLSLPGGGTSEEAAQLDRLLAQIARGISGSS